MNNRNKSYPLAVRIAVALVLVAVLLVGCGQKEPSLSDGTISEVVISAAVDENGRPLDTTTVFADDADAFFCSFKISNFPVGSRLKATLVYVGGEAEDEVGQNYAIDVNTGTIEREGKGYSYTVFVRAPIPDYKWAKGNYKIVISIDDQEKASGYFTVE